MMSKSKLEKLAKIRALGRKQFVLRYGVLGWGLSTGLTFPLVEGYMNGFDRFYGLLIPSLVLFPLGGILWGRLMWMYFEWMSKRAELQPR
jgi:hypothetical protein